MGDLIEFTAPRKHQNLFYKIKSNALVFSVKGEGKASIGLASIPNSHDITWVVIGLRNTSLIVKGRFNFENTVNHNLLSTIDYKKFWISWDNGCLKLGQDNMPKPLFLKENLKANYKFVTFSGLSQGNDLHWKCYLPPQTLFLKPVPKKLNGGKPYWVKFNKQLPEDAIIGGFENEILYIMRAFHENALTPGKFVPSTGKGYVAWGYDGHEKDDFEIFCGYDCIWIPSSGDKIPIGAIEAGYSQIVYERMYVGRALCDGHMIPGKIEPSHKVCYVAYEGRTVAKTKYEILVDPLETRKCVHDFFKSNVRLSR